MALQQDTTNLTTGVTVNNSYMRVESVQCKKTFMVFDLRKYKDKILQPFMIESFRCDYDINGENPFKQAYEYLKTLDEYSLSIDV